MSHSQIDLTCSEISDGGSNFSRVIQTEKLRELRSELYHQNKYHPECKDENMADHWKAIVENSIPRWAFSTPTKEDTMENVTTNRYAIVKVGEISIVKMDLMTGETWIMSLPGVREWEKVKGGPDGE